MKSTVLLLVIGTTFLFIGGNSVNAWGGIYNNRFSPEMLQNMGYGTPHRIYQESENFAEENELALDDDELCYGKRCTANEHCCPGSVCVDVDGVMGNCLFAYGRKLGELCRRDADCESGLICDLSAVSASVCRAPMGLSKQYSEDCLTSSDCDISRGLCCQLQRRHRQTPRKACLYFTDPLTCLGTVQVDQIKQHDVQHTAGEKRITSAFKHVLK